ncbi:peptidoglycan D,D-transpeptidase FtsI family protein [Streptomyces albidoflavus]|uniref:Cell division protein n=2 Tax=Streptomyces albidoflavus TaxID=1886 RepID=A0A8G2E1T2_9ACTN|nr:MULTISPECIES: penicillin-binding protein 2 [Streptomyces]NUW10015.1 penicillin-binding protein 2 [Streptomyces sp. CAI-21]QLA59431.1 penicillin-binding protein 2 [Streptomyces violascens]AWL31741.1 penicillin-binding protein 2 [Streptomyces sp. SM17]KUL57169.1 cell division protein [Streptomyces albidoflavus]MBK3385487.1 penicillin-binding protein 2 [Streptomyces sp. DEF147AK]
MSDRQPPRRRVPGPARPAGGSGKAARSGAAARGGAAKGTARKAAERRTPRAGQGSGRPAPRPRTPGNPPRRPGLRLGRPRPRLRLIGFALTLVMAVFVGRLLQLQAVDPQAYGAAAAASRSYSGVLAAERGAITDRNGVELASSVDAYDITADPSMFTPERTGVKDAPLQAAQILAPVLGAEAEEITAKLRRDDTRYVVLARRQTPQVWKQIKDLKTSFAEEFDKSGRRSADPETNSVLAGIFPAATSKRVYPGGDLAAGILGWVNAEGKGAGGLEAQWDKKLAGEDGRISYAQAGGRQVPTAGSEEDPAVPGSGLELTIDRDIQWAAQNAIAEQVTKSKAARGYVIVQDTATGEILALANAPGFDPNDLTRAAATSLGNAAVQDAYEPGSTAKVMSMAAVLEENAATPGTHVTVPNRLHRGDRLFQDDVDHPTWYLTLNGVLAKSSNIGTILAVEQLGKTQPEANKVLHSYLRKFGIGRPTGLGFPGETPGILAPPQDWSTSQQYTIPFGQGVSINALQAASVYSTIANGGVRVAPTLVRGTHDGEAFTPAPEAEKTRVVSEKTAKTLSLMLESVVDDEEGTGVKARIPGYRVAGKTGTANRVDPETGRYKGYTSSFAGFAPSDKPRVTVYCAIQDATRGSYFGGQICGPVYKQVMEFALKTLQVPPSGAKQARLPVTFTPED